MKTQVANQSNAVLALLLLIPMPSLAVWVGLIRYPDTPFGDFFFMFGKLWILLLPAAWLFIVDRERPTWRWPTFGSLVTGLASGLAIATVIFIAYGVFGDAIDAQGLRQVAVNIGMDNRVAYLALATYWVFINALLEEYVWRWFVVRQCRKLMLPLAAVLVSATGFTLHHIVATQLYFSLPLVLVAALGVFSGGVIWSWLFVRYGSIWPGYVSHVLADIAIFVIGYWLLFG